MFVQAQGGLVSGVGKNGIVVEPEHILGVKSYPAGERLAPDIDGLTADQRTMRSWRTIAHKVVWGSGIVRKQQTTTLDLMGSKGLMEFRAKKGLPELPRLVIVTDSGRDAGGAAGYTHPVFHTPGLRVILLTNEAKADKLTDEIHPTCKPMMGLGKSLTGSIPLWEVTQRYQGIFPHRSLSRGRMRFGRTRVGRSTARPCGPSPLVGLPGMMR